MRKRLQRIRDKRLNAWEVTGRVLESVDALLPGSAVKIVPTHYAMCTQSWELEVEKDGQWYELLAWGIYNDAIRAAPGW